MRQTGFYTKRFLFFRIFLTGLLTGIGALICKYLLESAQTLHYLLWHQGIQFLWVRLFYVLLLTIQAYGVYRLLQWHKDLEGDCFARVLTVYHYHLSCTWWKEIPGIIAGGFSALLCGLVTGYESIVLSVGGYLGYGISTLKY